MLSIDDCIALSDLSPEEVKAIAEHEHIPEIVAAELGNYIMQCPDGSLCVQKFILEDIATARAHGHMAHAAKLKLVLKHFVETHQELASRPDA
jgi:hypothetical protein